MAGKNLNNQSNGSRLSRLLIDMGTPALRAAFHVKFPPHKLAAGLIANKPVLKKLRYNVITTAQWKLLYPSSGSPDSRNFDITLLTVLLRNICGLTTPAKGWVAMPDPKDTSIAANVLRLKCYRNQLYAHVTSTEINDLEFEDFWKEISVALVALGISQKEIDELKEAPVSQEEDICIEQLINWKKSDDDLKEMVGNLQRHVKDLQNKMSKSNLFLSGADKLLSELENCNFQGEGDIEYFAESFQSGTRDRLFREVNGWFRSQTPDSRVMILTADPGVGKSMFAAKVCQLYHKKHKLAASYFCKFSNSNCRDPHTMLKSLAGQMLRSIPGFKKILRKQPQGYSTETISDAFRVLLNNPLHKLKPQKPMMIVIDALDESETGKKSELLEVIAEEFGKLPKWIKVFITSRPELPVQKKLSHLNPLAIRVDDKDNEEDLFKYLKKQLSGKHKRNDGSTRSLVQKCQGSFLYAFHLQKEIRDRGRSEFFLDDEPKGISSFYEKQFKELETCLNLKLSSCGKKCNFKKFISIVAAAKGPLPLKFLPECFDLPSDVNFSDKEEINGIISAFFPVYKDCLTVYHKSLVDWLKSDGYKEHYYTVTKKEGNEWLWQKCKTLFQKTNFPVETLSTELKYAIHHGYCHLRDLDGVDEQHADQSDYECLVNFDIVFHKLVLSSTDILNELLQQWRSTLINNRAKMDLHLQAKFHWHIMVLSLDCIPCSWYCQNVANSSPFGIFTEEETNSAKTALSDPKYVWCENLTNSEGTKTPVIAAQSLHSVSEVTSIGVSTNKELVAVAFRDRTISVFRLPSLEMLYSFKGCRGDFCLDSLTFLPGNSHIFCGKLDHCHDVKTGMLFPFFSNISVDDVKIVSCSFSPNGTRLVSSDSSNIVKLWDVNKQIPLASLYAGAPVNHCRFSKCGLFIVAANQNSDRNRKCFCGPYGYDKNDAFTIWNAISLQRVDRRENLIGTCRSGWPIFNVQAAAKFPEYQRISSEIVLSENGKYFEIFQLPQALLVARFPSFPPQYENPFTLRTPVPINYEGCNYILESAHSTLKVIDPLRLIVVAECRFLPFTCSNKVSPVVAGEFVLSVCDGALFVFEIPSQPPSVPTWPSPRVTCCSFSTDGSLLASCASDNWLRIWDVETSSIIRCFEIQAGEKQGCWWSKKSLWILNVTQEGTSLLKCSTSEKQKLESFHCCEIPLTLTQTKLLSFADDVLIFKCPNNTVSVSKIIDDEILPREILTSDKPIECAAVGHSSCILTASFFEFIVWKESIDEFHCHSWSRTIKRCIESSSFLLPWNVSNYHRLACSIDSNGRFVYFVVIRESMVQEDQKYFYCDSVIVDCLSGSNLEMKELHRFISPKMLKTYAGESLSVQLFASNRFLLRRLFNGDIIDAVDPKKGVVVGEWRPLGYQCQSILSETTTLPFFPQHNILAIPDEYGAMQFIKLRYHEQEQENDPRKFALEKRENMIDRCRSIF